MPDNAFAAACDAIVWHSCRSLCREVTTGEKRGGAMTDPVTAIAVGTIAKLAFDKFVESGAGELGKKAVAAAGDLVKTLQDKIKAKFQGNQRAEAAIATLEKENDPAALNKLEVYLDDEMQADPQFAAEVRQVAQQILNIQNQSNTSLNQQNINYGRDQNIFNQPQGDIRIGGN